MAGAKVPALWEIEEEPRCICPVRVQPDLAVALIYSDDCKPDPQQQRPRSAELALPRPPIITVWVRIGDDPPILTRLKTVLHRRLCKLETKEGCALALCT